MPDKPSPILHRVGVSAERLARTTALLGGLVLVAIAIMTGLSIAGRAFLWAGLHPVPGDFELVEAGTGFAVAAFMPWTQFKKGHASVAILTNAFGRRANGLIDLVGDVLLFATALLLSWRLGAGLIDKFGYGETTFILRFPLWWAYAAMLSGLIVWVVVGAWCVWASFEALRHGTSRSTYAQGPTGAQSPTQGEGGY